ncbi:hypothetical protein JCM11641_006758 [Rhodosporidiobolus odoratus]
MASSSTCLSAAETALLNLSTPPTSSSDTFIAACSALPEQALTTSFSSSLFRFSRSTGKLRAGVAFPSAGSHSQEDLLAAGVAALHAYAQVNWVGPALPLKPSSLFSPVGGEQGDLAEDELNEYAIDALALAGEPVYHLSKSTGFLLLALQIFGLIPSPFSPGSDSTSSSSDLPNAATTTRPFSASEFILPSLPIWRLRAGLMWLKVLDEPVPLPSYVSASAHALRLALPSHSPERASLTLSLSLLASLLSRASPHSSAQKEATTLAQAAAEEAELEWELTGRMGKRTKWQLEEKTQLVVLARDGSSKAAEEEKKDGVEEAAAKIPSVLDLNDDTLLEKTEFTTTPSSCSTAAAETEDDSPAHLTATSNASLSSLPLSSLDPANQPTITAFSQSLLLSLSLATLPAPTSLLHLFADVLSTSQISSFVARVLSHPRNWSVHSMALLLRCRAESGRSRTVERGVLQMQALVDQLRDGSGTEVSAISSAVKEEDMATARERLEQFHALALPPAWEMERELAVRYMSLGIVKSALEIFTRLGLWEEVARCWMSLERPDRGVEIIKSLLQGGKKESEDVMNERKGEGGKVFRGGEKREAKLWCTLGELERDPAHYEKAWEVSGHTSSRAQRSLGAVYWSSQEWAKASKALRTALKINPLYPRTWFTLGCCEMKLEEWEGAQEAFGRAVGLDGEDAEAWSNLASCHLRRGELEGDVGARSGAAKEEWDEELDEEPVPVGEDEKEAVISLPFSRKRAAFQCLRQSIKYSYDSWRLWYNYMIVSVDVGELSEACRSLDRIIQMRVDKDGEGAVDLDVLDRLVEAVTRAGRDENDKGEEVVDPNSGKGLLKPVQHLLEQTILPHVSNSPRIFLAHARLLLALSDYAGALEAHLKAYRAVVVDPTFERDLTAFRAAVERVEEVVTMLENLGSKDGPDGELVKKDWKFQARSLVRTFMGRTRDCFEDTEEYERLKEQLKELK